MLEDAANQSKSESPHSAVLLTQGQAIQQLFLKNKKRAYEALGYITEQIEEMEETLALLQRKKAQLEAFMIREGYM